MCVLVTPWHCVRYMRVFCYGLSKFIMGDEVVEMSPDTLMATSSLQPLPVKRGSRPRPTAATDSSPRGVFGDLARDLMHDIAWAWSPRGDGRGHGPATDGTTAAAPVAQPAVAVEGGAGLNACVFFTLRLLPVDAFIFSSLTS